MNLRILVCFLLVVVVPPIPGQTSDQTKPLDVRADVSKDWMDKINWVFSGTLVLIAGFGVWYARKTLREIQATGVQTDKMIGHAGTQAAALSVQANALLMGQRGWMLVEEVTPPRDILRIPEYGSREYMMPLTFVFRFRVSGQTPCRLLNGRVRFHAVNSKSGVRPAEPDFDEEPNYTSNAIGTAIARPAEIPDSGTVLAPNNGFQLIAYFDDGMMNEATVESIQRHEKLLCAYGFVDYRDAFDRPHITRFCYIYRFIGPRFRTITEDNVDMSRFVLGGPDAYNQTT
jgi:hypothetical protein